MHSYFQATRSIVCKKFCFKLKRVGTQYFPLWYWHVLLAKSLCWKTTNVHNKTISFPDTFNCSVCVNFASKTKNRIAPNCLSRITACTSYLRSSHASDGVFKYLSSATNRPISEQIGREHSNIYRCCPINEQTSAAVLSQLIKIAEQIKHNCLELLIFNRPLVY